MPEGVTPIRPRRTAARYADAVERLFIAYPGESKGLARRLELQSEIAGISTFLAATRLPHDAGGAPLATRIRDELDGASHMIVVYSEHARTRPWVHYEIGYARGRRIEPAVYVPKGRARLLRAVVGGDHVRRLVADLRARGVGTSEGRRLASLVPEICQEFLTTQLIRLANESQIWRDFAAKVLDLPDYFFDLPLRLSQAAVVRWFDQVAAGEPGALMERVASTDTPSQRVARAVRDETPLGMDFGLPTLPR